MRVAVTRLPGGHPEGYLEAFAVLYREFADGFEAWRAGKADPLPATLPGIRAGVRGMRFIERAIESNKSGQVGGVLSKVISESVLTLASKTSGIAKL